MEQLLMPFQFEFFRYGFVAAILVGALCGMIGVYVVLRGMSYIGHGLSHAIFGGAVASYVLGWNFYLGAGLWGFTPRCSSIKPRGGIASARTRQLELLPLHRSPLVSQSSVVIGGSRPTLMPLYLEMFWA